MKRTEIADLGLRKCNALGQEAPDIWSAGASPLTEFIHTLTDTFDTQILHTPFKEGMDNYCYLRAKNFADCSKRQRIACLYYTAPQLICRPDLWVRVCTDSGSDFSLFPLAQAGSVVSAQEPFIIQNAEPADGYELIAQINDRFNTLNPKPQVLSSLERAQLFDSPLWSKCYIPMRPAPAPYLIKTRLSIDVPVDMATDPTTYLLKVSCQGCKGAKLLVEGSRADVDQKPIRLQSSLSADQVVMETAYRFCAGFHALVTVTLLADDLCKLDHPVIQAVCHAAVSGQELLSAQKKGILYRPFICHGLEDENGFVLAGQVTLTACLQGKTEER